MRMTIMAALLAASFSAFATPGGEGDNTDCNGVGNPNSPCVGTGGSGSGSGGNSRAIGVGVGIGVGVAGATANNQTKVQVNNQVSNEVRTSNRTVVTNGNTNTNTATGGVGHGGQGGAGGSATATGGNASVGAISTSAQGGTGQGGNASQSQSASTGASTSTSSASTDGNTQILNVGGSVTNNPSDIKVLNTPDSYAPIASPTAPCRVAYSGGGSGPGFGISIGASALDEGCDAREDARLLYNLGMHNEAILRLCAKPELNAALGARCPKQPEKEEVKYVSDSLFRP